MTDKRQQQIGAFTKPVQFAGKANAESSAIFRDGVGHPGIFGVCPNLLVRIEFRRVSWKFLRDDLRMLRQIFPYRCRSVVDISSIPNNRYRPGDMSMKFLHKTNGIVGMSVFIVRKQCEVEASPLPLRTNGDGTDGRYPVAPIPASKNRGLASGRQRPSDRRCQHKPRLVLEDEGRVPLFGVFFILGNSSTRHPSIASSSRSRARRSGFWLVHFRRFFKMTRTWSGRYWMPKSRRMTAVTRWAVHNSVVHPFARAPFKRIRSSRRSWDGLIRLGLPGWGIGSSPDGPFWDISRQRNTELSLDPTISATSDGGLPCFSSPTALRRRRSNSSADPSGLISHFPWFLPLRQNTYITPINKSVVNR